MLASLQPASLGLVFCSTDSASTLHTVLIWPFALFPWPWRSIGVPNIPIFTYMHMPFCGALTAAWLHQRAALGQPAVRFLGTLAFLLLLPFYVINPSWFVSAQNNDIIQFYHEWTHSIGVLLPLQCLLIFGAFFTFSMLHFAHFVVISIGPAFRRTSGWPSIRSSCAPLKCLSHNCQHC